MAIAGASGTGSLTVAERKDIERAQQNHRVEVARNAARRAVDRASRGDRGPRSATAAEHEQSASAKGTESRSARHVVKSGESYWSIAERLAGPKASAKKLQAKFFALLHANGVKNPNGASAVLRIGQKLKVPESKEAREIESVKTTAQRAAAGPAGHATEATPGTTLAKYESIRKMGPVHRAAAIVVEASSATVDFEAVSSKIAKKAQKEGRETFTAAELKTIEDYNAAKGFWSKELEKVQNQLDGKHLAPKINKLLKKQGYISGP
jgi:LysM repeat protein